MKTFSLLFLLLTACTAPNPSTSTHQSALVCEPWCDPSDPDPDPWDVRTMSDATRMANDIFSDGTVTGSGCVVGTIHHSECWVDVSTADCDGRVDCVNWGSGPSDCQVSCE